MARHFVNFVGMGGLRGRLGERLHGDCFHKTNKKKAKTQGDAKGKRTGRHGTDFWHLSYSKRTGRRRFLGVMIQVRRRILFEK